MGQKRSKTQKKVVVLSFVLLIVLNVLTTILRGSLAPCKGAKDHIYALYWYQISAFYLDNQKSGPLGPTQGSLRGHEESYPTHMQITVFLFYEQYPY